jgi:hypothetical protein
LAGATRSFCTLSRLAASKKGAVIFGIANFRYLAIVNIDFAAGKEGLRQIKRRHARIASFDICCVRGIDALPRPYAWLVEP